MKRIATLSLILVMSLAPAVTGTALAAPKWTAKFGHDQPEKSPHHDGALYFKKLVEEGSKGEIEVKLYPSQLLGTGLQMSEMVQAGALEILAIPTSNMQVLQPPCRSSICPSYFPTKRSSTRCWMERLVMPFINLF